MPGLIKVANASYGRYEELIFRKNDLKKECFHLEMEYTRVFGDLIIAVFQTKVDCAKRKKTIEFFQASLNHGEIPEQKDLQDFVQKETEILRKHLNNMVDEYEQSKKSKPITEAELTKIKKIYRKIVKEIHPDINPAAKDSEKLQELWQSVMTAYTCNDLAELEQLEVLVEKALDNGGSGEAEIVIPDIDEKIRALEEEIKKIMETDPYQYKFLLMDSEAVEEKKRSLSEELKTYQEYLQQLDDYLAKILPEGMVLIWE